MAGRPLHVVAEPEGRERTYTNGETIFAVEGDREAQTRAGLVVQAALLAAGSLDAGTVGRLTGKSLLRHRYLTLEAIRAVHAVGGAVPGAVLRDVTALYTGDVSRSRDESIERVVKKGERVPEAPAWMGTIRPSKVIEAEEGENTGGAPTAKDQRGESRTETEEDEFDDEDETEESRIMELFSAPAMRNPVAEFMQRLLGMGRSPQADSGGGQELPIGGSRAGKVGRDAKRAKAPDELAFQAGTPLGRLYPEWNHKKRSYRPDWCSVAEFDPRVTGDDEPAAPPEDRRLRRELARLGLAPERHRREDDGETLDLGALVEHVLERRAGGSPDGRVYEARRMTGHDLGVLVLLDCTGSTGEATEASRVFDEQRTLAARLVAGFDELGDRVAAYGFQSWGRESVRFLRVKDFDGRYDSAARRRMAALGPSGYTRLGAAVRHGTWMLSERAGTSSTLMIVVGDGLPYDEGYEDRYAQEDSRRALAEAVRHGVGAACVSVGTTTAPRVIERVWGHVPYRSLDTPDQLARHVTPLLRGALKEAAATRRRTGPRK